jgi:hypothetical protein
VHKELVLLCAVSRVSLQLKNYERCIVEKKRDATALREVHFFRRVSSKISTA